MIKFLKELWKELTDPNRGLNPDDCIGLEVMAQYGECMGMGGTFWAPPQRAWITRKYSGKYGENFTVDWQFFGPSCVNRRDIYIRFVFNENDRIRPAQPAPIAVEVIDGVVWGYGNPIRCLGNGEEKK